MEDGKRLLVMNGRRVGKAALLKLMEEPMNNDTPTNRYHDYLEQLKKNEKTILDMKRTKNAVTLKKAHAAIGRNDPCPCGSGKKYKHCHMTQQERQYVVVS